MTQPRHDRAITRRLAAGGLAAAGAAALAAACGPLGQGQPRTGSTAQPAKLLWEIRGSPTYEELTREGLALFKQRQPQIEVEYFAKPGGWAEKHIAAWAAGTGPDVIQAWDQFFWQFAAASVLVNVNDLLKDYKKSDLDDFVKGQWNGFQIPNTSFRFGMPTYINTGVLYYNKNTFRKFGVKEPDATWTYNDYAENSKRLTRVDAGQQVFGSNHPTTGWVRTQNHLWAFGGHYVDPKDFRKSAAHLPPAQQALEWLHDRYWRDNSWIQPKQRPSPWNFWTGLGSGVIAMAEDGMHALKDMARVEGMEFDIAPVPKGPARRLSWITTDGWGLWNGSKYRQAAWELAKFITGTDWFKLQSRIELLIPSRVSLLDDWIQVVRAKFPVLQRVNLKAVRDAMTASPPVVSTWEQFPCFADAIRVIQDALNELYRDGTARPSVFRDRKDQLEQAAVACGATFK